MRIISLAAERNKWLLSRKHLLDEIHSRTGITVVGAIDDWLERRNLFRQILDAFKEARATRRIVCKRYDEASWVRPAEKLLGLLGARGLLGLPSSSWAGMMIYEGNIDVRIAHELLRLDGDSVILCSSDQKHVVCIDIDRDIGDVFQGEQLMELAYMGVAAEFVFGLLD